VEAAYEVDGLSLSEYKAAVHRSPAWSDEFAAREEVIRLLQEEVARD
jgi:hypothetical protein